MTTPTGRPDGPPENAEPWANTACHANAKLSPACLHLAVTDCVLAGLKMKEIEDRLWREDPNTLREIADRIRIARVWSSEQRSGRHGLMAERVRQLRRPLHNGGRRGMTIAEIAASANINRETLACLMEHHAYLELAPYGGRQRRRLVTEQAISAGLGANVDGSTKRIARLEGAQRACVFPVFYQEHVASILWTLDYQGITEAAHKVLPKRERLDWLLDHHRYLPNTELAALSGYRSHGSG
jgi:hypothetical protein